MNQNNNQGRRPEQHAFAETVVVVCVVTAIAVVIVRWISGW